MMKLANSMLTQKMKTIHYISVISTLLATLGSSQTFDKSQMRDATTHAQLSLAHSKSEQTDPMRKMVPANGPDPSLISPPKDLIANSDIICFGGFVTLVPKLAVLETPKNLADRLKFQPGSKIISWADFYAKNRGWITTIEVSRVQAEGNKPMTEEDNKRISKSTNLIVATYQNGPISVLPLKIRVETEKTASSQNVKIN